MQGKTVDQLVRIAMAGGGFRMSAGGKTVDQITRIVMASGDHPSRIEITDCEHLTADQLFTHRDSRKG